MSYSSTRLTLYALLSSMETDFRRIIYSQLNGMKPSPEILGSGLWANAKNRLNKDFGVLADDEISLSDALLYVDFGDLFQIINRHKALCSSDISNHIKSITTTIEGIVPIRNRVAHTRPLNYDDFNKVWDTAKYMIQNLGNVWTELSQTFHKIETDPSYVLSLHIPVISSDSGFSHNLPIPDFDETGFIGRTEVVNQLVNLCKGAYPVITIVGEGGIGKTALALKVAYDLMDSSEKLYDAIIWSSAKTTQLTSTQIVQIDNSIRNSLGMLQAVSESLTGIANPNPMDEILEYLKNFRVLLILDNLETVVDARIHSFMQGLPTGSKILITSRIGLGAFEFPVKLQPLEERDAVQLVRAVARMRGVQSIASLDNSRLSSYCKRMKNNPGFIKWFVSAIQSGKRPEEVLDKPNIFLEFCMSNVYDYLESNSKKVLKSMLAYPGQHSQPELAFLNSELGILNLQKALQQLLTTNMVQLRSIERGGYFESSYEISELARTYLEKHHPLSTVEFKDFSKKRNQLISANEAFTIEQSGNPYAIFRVNTRSKSDIVVAKYLSDVLKIVKNKWLHNLESANKKIDEARSLAPEYYEVHRVEAVLRVFQGNYSAARTAYEAALELEPNFAPLHVWYGEYLLEYLSDNDTALSEFQKASKLDAKALSPQIYTARVLLYLKKYSESKELLDKLMTNVSNLSIRDGRTIYNTYLQYFARYAEFLEERHNTVQAIEHLEEMRNHYEKAPRELVDSYTVKKIKKAIPTIKKCLYSVDDLQIAQDFKQRAQKIKLWLENEEISEYRFKN